MFKSKLFALSPLLLSLCACGPSGGSGTDEDGGSSQLADAEIFADASCGAQTEEIDLVVLNDPPDLLVVLDRSGSMSLAPGFPPIGTSKWSIMKDALRNITSTYNMNIRFGLSAFPDDGNDCGIAPGADVAIALDQADEISTWLSDNDPTGNTPAHFALQNALDIYNSVPANPEGQYVLFATDGSPNCGGNPPNVDVDTPDETVAAVQALANAGINTYVIGFGDIFSGLSSLLNDAAQAGGRPRAGGPPYFYEADDANSLNAALMEIAGGIILPSCSFALASAPPEPDRVTVTLGGTPVPRDRGHNNGWDYHPDANTITFFGAACDAVQTGDTEVSFVFGCPGPEVD